MKKLVLVSVALVCLIVFFLIVNPASLYFLNDDSLYIPTSKNWQFLYGASFRPMSNITLLIDYLLWGTNATGYHITNIILHVITTILFFFLATAIFKKYGAVTNQYKAFAATILFFFYPFHSEAVFWIIGRGGLLGCLFGIASLYLYAVREKSNWYLAGSLLCFIIGAFAYETIWIVPLIIILFTFFDIRKQPIKRNAFISHATIFWSFFFLYILVRFWITGEIVGSPYGTTKIIHFNIALLLKNFNIMVARSFLPPLQSITFLIILYCALILVAILFARVLILRQKVSISIIIIVISFLLSFLPVLTLGVDSHDSESERFLYFPSVFAVMLLTEIVFNVNPLRYKRAFFFFGILLLELFYLYQTAKIYRVSSLIASISIKAIARLDKTRHIYCIDLPSQYKGGLIFRSGFKESAEWLAGVRKENIVEISQREIKKTLFSYKVSNTTFGELSAEESGLILKQLAFDKISKDTAVILKWTDSSLLIIN